MRRDWQFACGLKASQAQQARRRPSAAGCICGRYGKDDVEDDYFQIFTIDRCVRSFGYAIAVGRYPVISFTASWLC